LSAEGAADEPSQAGPPGELTREYRFDRGGPAPTVEQRIVDDEGSVYLLKEVGEPVADFEGAPERSFSATVQRPVPLEVDARGEAAVREVFGESLDLDTGDYAGVLQLQSLTGEPLYFSVEEQTERVAVFSGLVSEDVAQLPEYREFPVTSDEAPGAATRQTLRRMAVSWETAAYDEDGRPSLYTATVVFRGTQRYLAPDYRMVTALYTGSIPAKQGGQSVAATYALGPSGSPAPTVPTIRPVEVTGDPVPLVVPSLAFDPFVVAGASTVVVLLGLLCFLHLFYWNARLVRAVPSGRRRVLVRRHVRIERGEALFRLDPSMPLCCEDASHLVVFNRRLAGRQARAVLLWGDRQVLSCGMRREIDITQELLYASAGAEGAYLSIGRDAELAAASEGGRG
jgi:hypothetical protein